MSAAEKLGRLDRADVLEKYEIDLFAVLPQIVAVVEAAELAEPFAFLGRSASGKDAVAVPPEDWRKIRAALAALDEALA